MITKERLEELIEQGATVYELFMDKEILKVELNKNYYIMLDKTYENKLGKLPQRPHWLSDLFETKEDAKWFVEFGCIERTERLELPTWEEIQKYKRFDFKDKYNHSYTLHYISGFKTLAISGWSTEYYAPATKENYTLACRKARELFLGLGENNEI